MSTMFERFSKMAKEEFGLTVVKIDSGEMSTFESLFGVSTETLAQYELPYNISAEIFGRYGNAMPIHAFENYPQGKRFETNANLHLAA